jgi:hypothetical protein
VLPDQELDFGRSGAGRVAGEVAERDPLDDLRDRHFPDERQGARARAGEIDLFGLNGIGWVGARINDERGVWVAVVAYQSV